MFLFWQIYWILGVNNRVMVWIYLIQNSWHMFNTWRPRQNGRHVSDDIFKDIFLNEIVWILFKISLKFVPKVQIDNIPALVQMMTWCWPGNKPLSEPMVDSLLTHICITRPHLVNMWVFGLSSQRANNGEFDIMCCVSVQAGEQIVELQWFEAHWCLLSKF